MIRPVHHTVQRVAVIFIAVLGGCATTTHQPSSLSTSRPTERVPKLATKHLAIIVPGVFGDGPWYDGLRAAAAEREDAVETFSWGASKSLFFENFSNAEIHKAAEQSLAERIDAAAAEAVSIDFIGHSAGCGVVLGALAICHGHAQTVILLAPSVSPAFPVCNSMARADVGIYCFYSDRDTLFLKWRTGNFGTYDRKLTVAAGNSGFTHDIPRLRQVPYRSEWAALGNDGGHGGTLAAAFAHQIISPLLRQGDDTR